MWQPYVLFTGQDDSGAVGLRRMDGTATGTVEIKANVRGAHVVTTSAEATL